MERKGMKHPIIGYGLIVEPSMTHKGEIVYAELLPSSPLIQWPRGRKGWRRFTPYIGRHNPFSRWWYEIHSTNAPKNPDNPTGIGLHYHEHDGGAFTFRQAMYRASNAVEEVVDEQDGVTELAKDIVEALKKAKP